MRIAGTWPMLYAFFQEDGGINYAAFDRQVEAARRAGADGVAVLGLGTEVTKLSRAEREAVITRVIAAARDLPVAVTISEGSIPDAQEAARFAESAGATWLILQPPRPPASGADLITFFAKVAGAASCPVGIQNAPEFLGIGLTPAELCQLSDVAPNITVAKAESSAVALGDLVEALQGRMTVLNGRAGLELTDNYRAGADGMIPGIETVDLQVAIAKAMQAGDEARAEELYRQLLPAVAFFMQGIGALVSYGKHIAALRMGIEPDHGRVPFQRPTARGLAWAERFAKVLGPLA